MPAAPKPSAAALSVSHCIQFPKLPRGYSGKTPDPSTEVRDKRNEIGLLCRNTTSSTRTSTAAERRLCLMCARKGSPIPWGVQRAGQCMGSPAEDRVLEELVMLNRHGCCVGPWFRS